MIRLTRHPGERRLRRRDVAGCSGACCCCCCCLHTVGAVVGAIQACRLPPEPFVSLPPRPARRTGAARAASKPAPRPSLHPDAQQVLALFVLFWLGERARSDGALGLPAYDALCEELRRRVQEVWQRLFGGHEPTAYAWMLDRIEMFERAGTIPAKNGAALREALRARGPSAGPAPLGFLAHIWKLHLLYLELDDAAARGVIPAEVLPDLRGELIGHVMVAVGGLDPERAGDGHSSDRPFSNEVWEAAGALVETLRDAVPAEALALLAAELPGGRAQLSVRPGGRCLVCGDQLAGWKLVRCAACATPHHADCWTYNTGCATYACGCVELEGAVRKPEAPPAVALDREPPREVSPVVRAVDLFWGLSAVLCLGTVAAFDYNAWMLLFVGPLCLFGAAIVTIVVMAVMARPGRMSGVTRAAKILMYSFGWTLLGGLAMAGCALPFIH